MSTLIKYSTKEEAAEAKRQKSRERYYKKHEQIRQRQKEYYQKNREIINQHKNSQALLHYQLAVAKRTPQTVILEVVDENPTIHIDQTQIDKIFQNGTIVSPVYSS
jgi:hypothetical protein